jgi:hypothetical protein
MSLCRVADTITVGAGSNSFGAKSVVNLTEYGYGIEGLRSGEWIALNKRTMKISLAPRGTSLLTGPPRSENTTLGGSELGEGSAVYRWHSRCRTLRSNGDTQLRRACTSSGCRHGRLKRIRQAPGRYLLAVRVGQTHGRGLVLPYSRQDHRTDCRLNAFHGRRMLWLSEIISSKLFRVCVVEVRSAS